MATKVYRVSPTFWWDHVSRGLASEEVVRSAGRFCVYVELDDEQYDELLADAVFYAEDGPGFDFDDYRSLQESARRVRAVLAKEGPPEGSTAAGVSSVAEGGSVFGWCLPGPEEAHSSCRVEYFSEWSARHRRCACSCHVRQAGSDA